MAVNNMKPTLLVLVSFLIQVKGFMDDDPILVNNLLDEALDELSTRIAAREDITERTDPGSVGDYIIYEAKFADLASLKRVGEAWMWNKYRTIIVNSTLSLETMFLAHANVTGPESVPDPVITVNKNYLNFHMNITLDAKSHCFSEYYFKWTLIDGVTLYSGNPRMCNIDLSSWVKRNMDSVNNLLVNPLIRLFEENIHMCQSKWLNKMESLKYEALIKADMMNETYK